MKQIADLLLTGALAATSIVNAPPNDVSSVRQCPMATEVFQKVSTGSFIWPTVSYEIVPPKGWSLNGSLPPSYLSNSPGNFLYAEWSAAESDEQGVVHCVYNTQNINRFSIRAENSVPLSGIENSQKWTIISDSSNSISGKCHGGFENQCQFSGTDPNNETWYSYPDNTYYSNEDYSNEEENPPESD